MLNCYKCKKEIEPQVEEKVFSNGTKHLSASCPDCGQWIKYLPQEIEPEEYIMPFGKNKGKKLKDIENSYLEWLAQEAKPRLKKLAQDVLDNKIIDKLFEPSEEEKYKKMWRDHDSYNKKYK